MNKQTAERELQIQDAIERLSRCNATFPNWTEINIKIEIGREIVVKPAAKIDKAKNNNVK